MKTRTIFTSALQEDSKLQQHTDSVSTVGEDLEQLMEDVQYSMMLAQAHKMGGDIPQAIEVLHTAQNIQSRSVLQQQPRVVVSPSL